MFNLFKELLMYFPQWLYHFTFPLAMCVPISPHLCQYLFLSVCFILVILMGMKWYLIVLLICTLWWLIMLDPFYMFIGRLYIFFEKCLFKYFVYLKLIFVFLLLICKSFLYILDTSPLLDMLVANISSILLVVFSLS